MHDYLAIVQRKNRHIDTLEYNKIDRITELELAHEK